MRTFSTAFRILSPSPIKLKRIGHFVENAFRHFQSLSGEFVNFVFRLEETGERDKDRHDGGRENVRAKVSGGFVVPENSG